MSLYEKIKQIYPSLEEKDFLSVISLQNDSDGKGDYIAKWEHPTLARPTDEQLESINGS
jgi:XkdW protein